MIKISTDAAFNPKIQESGIGIQINHGKQQELIKIHISEVVDNHVAEFFSINRCFKLC